MKKETKQIIVLLLLCFALCFADNLFAQNVVKGKDGNYTDLPAKTEKDKAKLTGQKYTDNKGTVYPVYLSVKGKIFIVMVSKTTGKEYNKYLKESN